MNKKTILITVSGPDKPGMVSMLAEIVAMHDGNWLESRMANLGGQFAGIIRIEVDESRQEDLLTAAQALHSSALNVTLLPVEDDTRILTAGRDVELEMLGQDQPGIVRDISRVLSDAGVSVQAFDSFLEEASMAGGMLFHAHAHLSVPEELGTEQLHDRLQSLSDSLMIDINLVDLE